MADVMNGLALSTRPYEDADEPEVLELLSASLGGGPAGRRTSGFFRWKHLENPSGRSYLRVAQADGRIVGLRAFLRWSFRSGGRTIRAVRAVDTATHPSYQGRGIFSRLTLEAVEDLRADTDLVFNTPNEKSLPGYLKMGWRRVGTFPVGVRIRRPARLLAGIADARRPGDPSRPGPEAAAKPALEALSDPGLGALLQEVERGSWDERLHTPRDEAYLRWRYGLAPELDYRAIRVHRGGSLAGLALFRVRPRGRLWETTLSELLVGPRDEGAARRLLAAVVRAAPVDHLTCCFPRGTVAGRAARRSGFLSIRRGMMLVANPLGPEPTEPDPTDVGSWAMTLGDLEVF